MEYNEDRIARSISVAWRATRESRPLQRSPETVTVSLSELLVCVSS